MTGAQIWWACWAAASFTGFALPEMIAVFTGHPNWKLSQAVWVLEDEILPGQPIWWRAALFVTLIVVAYHLTLGPRH